MKRPDRGHARWIARAIVRARIYLGEGVDIDAAAEMAMSLVEADSAAGLVGGIGPRTRDAARLAWSTWTAEVADYLRRRQASAPLRTGAVS